MKKKGEREEKANHGVGVALGKKGKNPQKSPCPMSRRVRGTMKIILQEGTENPKKAGPKKRSGRRTPRTGESSCRDAGGEKSAGEENTSHKLRRGKRRELRKNGVSQGRTRNKLTGGSEKFL